MGALIGCSFARPRPVVDVSGSGEVSAGLTPVAAGVVSPGTLGVAGVSAGLVRSVPVSPVAVASGNAAGGVLSPGVNDVGARLVAPRPVPPSAGLVSAEPVTGCAPAGLRPVGS